MRLLCHIIIQLLQFELKIVFRLFTVAPHSARFKGRNQCFLTREIKGQNSPHFSPASVCWAKFSQSQAMMAGCVSARGPVRAVSLFLLLASVSVGRLDATGTLLLSFDWFSNDDFPCIWCLNGGGGQGGGSSLPVQFSRFLSVAHRG